MLSLQTYKEKYHFSVNLYSLYLLATFIPDIIGINSTIIRYGYWGVKVLLAFWIVAKSKTVLFNFTRWESLIFIVFAIYGVNIFIDVFVSPLPSFRNGSGGMDFLGFVIILILLLSFRYDPAYYSSKSFWFFVLSLTGALAIAYFLAVPNFKLDVHNVRYDANSTINSIGYGQAGCALSLVSLLGITNYKQKGLKLFFIITFIVGMLSIAKAGSRSPVVVLVLVMAFYFMARLGSIQGIVILCLVGGLFFIFSGPILELMASMGSNLAVRLTNSIKSGETSGRDEIWTNTLQIISTSPIFGVYYLVPSGVGAGGYPHNFFLEVFLATGVLGGLPFLLLIFVSVKKSYKTISAKHPSSWIVVLYLQMIVFGLFSSGLYSSQDFWALIFFVMSIKDEVKTPKPVRASAAPVYHPNLQE